MHKNSQSSNYQRGNSFSFESTMDDVCCIVSLSVLLYLFRGNTFNETDIARFIGSKIPNWTIFTISRTIERIRKCIYNLLNRKQKFQKRDSLLIKRHKEQRLQRTMCKAMDATKEEKGKGRRKCTIHCWEKI